jgi:hypothetical protein
VGFADEIERSADLFPAFLLLLGLMPSAHADLN